MKIKFALCAQTASVDRASNRISIFNVYDHFPVSSIPITIPSITFVSVVESDEGENTTNIHGTIEIVVDETDLFKVEVPITFADHHLARIVLTFQGIPVRKTGPVTFKFSLPGSECAEASFRVVNVANESLQLNPSATH